MSGGGAGRRAARIVRRNVTCASVQQRVFPKTAEANAFFSVPRFQRAQQALQRSTAGNSVLVNMHASQATLLAPSNKMTAPLHPTTAEELKVEERRRKMAIAAGNEGNSLRLRSNLLHKLGIRDSTKSTEIKNRQPARGLLDGAAVTNEPLKYESDEDTEIEDGDGASGSRSWTERLFFKPSSIESNAEETATSSVSSMSTEKRLTFNEQVKIMPIPMRHDYSQRVRERLWNDVDDIMLNAQRNAMEFAAEG